LLSPRDNIRVFSATGVTIANNIISGPLTFGFPGINLTNVDNAAVYGNCVGDSKNATMPLISLTNANGTNAYPTPSKGIEFCNASIPTLPASPLDPLVLGSGRSVLIRSGYSGLYVVVSVGGGVAASAASPTSASTLILQAASGGYAIYYKPLSCYLSINSTKDVIVCTSQETPFVFTNRPAQLFTITYIQTAVFLTLQPTNNQIYTNTHNTTQQIPFQSLFFVVCPDGTNTCPSNNPEDSQASSDPSNSPTIGTSQESGTIASTSSTSTAPKLNNKIRVVVYFLSIIYCLVAIASF